MEINQKGDIRYSKIARNCLQLNEWHGFSGRSPREEREIAPLLGHIKSWGEYWCFPLYGFKLQTEYTPPPKQNARCVLMTETSFCRIPNARRFTYISFKKLYFERSFKESVQNRVCLQPFVCAARRRTSTQRESMQAVRCRGKAERRCRGSGQRGEPAGLKPEKFGEGPASSPPRAHCRPFKADALKQDCPNLRR